MLLVAAVAALVSSGPASAACTAFVVSTSHAQGNPKIILRPGERWGPPTQLVVDTKKHVAYLCGHGTLCYDAEGIALRGCRVVPIEPQWRGDDEMIIFSLE
jgi:hypothetical protein